MTEVFVSLVTSVTINNPTKFVVIKTVLLITVTRGIQTLANLELGAIITRKMFVFTHMLLLPVMMENLMLLQRNLNI